ncbi:MAG: FAD-binding oxidoreductase [Desulfobacter sp.]
MKTADVVIIGGGITGSAVGLGLVRSGAGKVIILDAQLSSQRLSRGNFGLTWFMCKGAGYPGYAMWSRRAAVEWPEFAGRLEQDTGYDIELEWTGGAVHAFGREEWEGHAESVNALGKVCEGAGLDYPVQMLDRDAFAGLMPDIRLGEEVSGGMYTPDQGHVNPLKLLAAVRCGFQEKGGVYYADRMAREIVPKPGGSVEIRTGHETFQCKQLVIAAGHGSARLTGQLGEKLHIFPQRGQLMVTERCPKVLDVPLLCVRQTCDGSFLVGLSTENTALDTRVRPEAMKSQAMNAIRVFPMLGRVNWVRAWGAVRVMTPDGGPVYSRVAGHDNIRVLALHSGVSLAPLHAGPIASWILGEYEDEQIPEFSNGRFQA